MAAKSTKQNWLWLLIITIVIILVFNSWGAQQTAITMQATSKVFTAGKNTAKKIPKMLKPLTQKNVRGKVAKRAPTVVTEPVKKAVQA